MNSRGVRHSLVSLLAARVGDEAWGLRGRLEDISRHGATPVVGLLDPRTLLARDHEYPMIGRGHS